MPYVRRNTYRRARPATRNRRFTRRVSRVPMRRTMRRRVTTRRRRMR